MQRGGFDIRTGKSFEAEVPSYQTRFGAWAIPPLLSIITLFFSYNVRAWGLPLATVASVVVIYTKVITAAFLPAIVLFFSIFLAVLLQSLRENVQAMRGIPDDLVMDRQD